MKDVHTIVCDGGKKMSMTYASFKVFSPEGDELGHHWAFLGFGTSNTAEYLALINSIKYCHRNGIKRVIFRSDSLPVINQISGEWRTKNTNLKGLRKIAISELARLDEYELIKMHHKEVKKILGH